MPPGSPKEQRNPPDKMSQGKKKKNNQYVGYWFALFFFSLQFDMLIKKGGRGMFQKLAKGLCESFNVSELMQGSQ